MRTAADLPYIDQGKACACALGLRRAASGSGRYALWEIESPSCPAPARKWLSSLRLAPPRAHWASGAAQPPRQVALGTHEPPAESPLLRGRPRPAAARSAVSPPPAAPSRLRRPRQPPVQPPPRGLRRHRPSVRPEGGGAGELVPASRWRRRHRLLVLRGLHLLLRAAHPAPRPAQGLRGLETESARLRAGPQPARAGAECYPGGGRAGVGEWPPPHPAPAPAAPRSLPRAGCQISPEVPVCPAQRPHYPRNPCPVLSVFF